MRFYTLLKLLLNVVLIFIQIVKYFRSYYYEFLLYLPSTMAPIFFNFSIEFLFKNELSQADQIIPRVFV